MSATLPNPFLCHCYQFRRTQDLGLPEHPDPTASLPSPLAHKLQPSSTFLRQFKVIPALGALLLPPSEALSFQVVTWLILSPHHSSLSAISPPHPDSSSTPPPHLVPPSYFIVHGFSPSNTSLFVYGLHLLL